MEHMKLILTDIDDTLLKFGDAFQEWAESKGYQSNGTRVRECCSIQDVFNFDRETVTKLVVEFSNDKDLMSNLIPEKDALAVIPVLYKMGYQFVAISACVEVTEIRRKSLEDAFGIPWLDVHCTGLEQPKHEVLSSYDTSWWVEDNITHALAGAEIGHRTFLLDRPYNQTILPVGNPIRVNSWHYIFEHIISENKNENSRPAIKA